MSLRELRSNVSHNMLYSLCDVLYIAKAQNSQASVKVFWVAFLRKSVANELLVRPPRLAGGIEIRKHCLRPTGPLYNEPTRFPTPRRNPISGAG